MPPSRARRLLRRRPGLVAGCVLVGAVVLAALVGPLVDRHAPDRKDVQAGLSELGEPLPPSADRPLGTDVLGRCVASRLLAGARLSLAAGAGATAIAVVLGLLVGLLAGTAGRAGDTLLMRGVDLVLAFPFLLLAIALAAVFRGAAGGGAGAGDGVVPVVLVLGLVGWTGIARVVRGEVLALRSQPFVLAARSLGAGRARIVLRHLLANVAGPVIILATLLLAQMILAEATLSYLGLGAPPPVASWGRMLHEGQPYLRGAPWLVAAPGIAILVTALGLNLLGEGLRGALDPRD